MSTITAAMLRDRGACAGQVKRFEKLFGESVEVTVEGAIAVAGEFDWAWAARKFFPKEAMKAYYDTMNKAWLVCKYAVDIAADAYDNAKQTKNEYENSVMQAWGAYHVTAAKAFAEAYLA